MFCIGSVLISSCGKEKPKEEDDEPEEPMFFYELNDIIVNPSGSTEQRIMLASVSVQLKKLEDVKAAEEKASLIKDVIITALSSKTIEELTSTGYKDSLKIELKTKLTKRIKTPKIRGVYFTKFIVQ